jgi:hypothetical protein
MSSTVNFAQFHHESAWIFSELEYMTTGNCESNLASLIVQLKVVKRAQLSLRQNEVNRMGAGLDGFIVIPMCECTIQILNWIASGVDFRVTAHAEKT